MQKAKHQQIKPVKITLNRMYLKEDDKFKKHIRTS